MIWIYIYGLSAYLSICLSTCPGVCLSRTITDHQFYRFVKRAGQTRSIKRSYPLLALLWDGHTPCYRSKSPTMCWRSVHGSISLWVQSGSDAAIWAHFCEVVYLPTPHVLWSTNYELVFHNYALHVRPRRHIGWLNTWHKNRIKLNERFFKLTCFLMH